MINSISSVLGGDYVPSRCHTEQYWTPDAKSPGILDHLVKEFDLLIHQQQFQEEK